MECSGLQPVLSARPRDFISERKQMNRHDVCSRNVAASRQRSVAMLLQRFPSPFASERVRVSVALILFLIAGNVFAQSNERVYEELDFRFVTPGARAVAMGKTFVGLAD